jgi:hypothetical protein
MIQRKQVLLVTVIFIICSLQMTAQKDFQHDTAYYETFPKRQPSVFIYQKNMSP